MLRSAVALALIAGTAYADDDYLAPHPDAAWWLSGQVNLIGQDLVAMARKEAGKIPAAPVAGTDGALQARKDLTAMGLRYYDAAQFLEAVKRDDALAVELYLAGRGVNPSAKGADGRSALEIARANGNERLAELLSGKRP